MITSLVFSWDIFNMSSKLSLCGKVGPAGTYAHISIVAGFNKACSALLNKKVMSLGGDKTFIFAEHYGLCVPSWVTGSREFCIQHTSDCEQDDGGTS